MADHTKYKAILSNGDVIDCDAVDRKNTCYHLHFEGGGSRTTGSVEFEHMIAIVPKEAYENRIE